VGTKGNLYIIDFYIILGYYKTDLQEESSKIISIKLV